MRHAGASGSCCCARGCWSPTTRRTRSAPAPTPRTWTRRSCGSSRRRRWPDERREPTASEHRRAAVRTDCDDVGGLRPEERSERGGEQMSAVSGRATLATARRVLTQLRNDRRTVAMLLVAPCVLITLFKYVFQNSPGVFD